MNEKGDGMRPEYDFSGGVRGKYLKAVESLPPVESRNDVVIKFLREALEMAERGEINGVVLVIEHAVS